MHPTIETALRRCRSGESFSGAGLESRGAAADNLRVHRCRSQQWGNNTSTIDGFRAPSRILIVCASSLQEIRYVR